RLKESLSSGRRKTWRYLRTYNYHDPWFVWGSFLTIVLIVLFSAIYTRLTIPQVIETVDVHPFESVEEYHRFMEQNPLFTAKVPEDMKFTKSAKVHPNKVPQYVIELSTRP